MHAKLPNYIFTASVFMYFALISGQSSASNTTCFPNLQAYLKVTYGETYENDENIIINEKLYGNEKFTLIEDITSGANHSFALLKESQAQACLLLITRPIVSLKASAYDKAGFPTNLISTEQTSPGFPMHEISYAFDPKKQIYSVNSCREIRYKERRRYETKVDCDKILNY